MDRFNLFNGIPIWCRVATLKHLHRCGVDRKATIGGVLMLMGAISAMFALIADLVAYNRQLLELTLERVRKIEYAIDAEKPTTKKRFPAQKIRDELSALKSRVGG